ncbi:hypothetical protein [Micromonospora chokoriensis]|uniref:Uncharacterized protein n=1 Tax=Micromonospora chokoriensis TaxID=356851 RepID=A0A1C4W9L6_9ACTN|nr:hypothetical protein [Micromonospora chokoriensis]SCE92872.1 hypothetical protein GA0070612_2266 [Micromonospora chokoriensis]
MLFLGLILAALGGAVAATILAVGGFRAMVRRQPGRLRAAALLVGAGAVAVYAWGLLHLGYAVMQAENGGTGASPIEPCREVGPQVASMVDGYGVSLFPVHFEFHLTGGGSYVTSSVPGYVTPATVALGLITVICAAFAATTAKQTRPPVT